MLDDDNNNFSNFSPFEIYCKPQMAQNDIDHEFLCADRCRNCKP